MSAADVRTVRDDVEHAICMALSWAPAEYAMKGDEGLAYLLASGVADRERAERAEKELRAVEDLIGMDEAASPQARAWLTERLARRAPVLSGVPDGPNEDAWQYTEEPFVGSLHIGPNEQPETAEPSVKQPSVTVARERIQRLVDEADKALEGSGVWPPSYRWTDAFIEALAADGLQLAKVSASPGSLSASEPDGDET